jgi:hypothetical protein
VTYICFTCFRLESKETENELELFKYEGYRMYVRAKIAQSVQRLATGWTVGGSNPGRGRDFSHTSRPALGTGSFRG